MNTLEAAVGRVLDLTAREAPDGDELMAACQAVLQLAQRAPADRVGDALSRMTVALRHEHPQVAGLVAICSGALVESGAPAALLGRPLMERLPAVLSAAGGFVSAVYEAMPEPEGDDGEEPGDGDDEFPEVEVRGRRVPPEVLGPLFERDLFSVLSYLSLEQWCFPSIACLTRERAVRDHARSRPELFEMALQLSGANHAAQCLFKALAVFDDEPLLVLHPGEGKGYRMRFGGIADNFQLHVLLADVLIAAPPASEEQRGLWARLTGSKSTTPPAAAPPDRLSGERPAPSLVATWRGEGPQQVGAPSHGVWNLYQWTAVRPDATLPGHDVTGGQEEYGKHWVWNEGIPWDIPAFEGTRVLLLGPASYVRSFNTARFFDALPATLALEAELNPGEVDSWMRRFAAAPRPPELAGGETGSPAWK